MASAALELGPATPEDLARRIERQQFTRKRAGIEIA
jgi:hypothetical protein